MEGRAPAKGFVPVFFVLVTAALGFGGCGPGSMLTDLGPLPDGQTVTGGSRYIVKFRRGDSAPMFAPGSSMGAGFLAQTPSFYLRSMAGSQGSIAPIIDDTYVLHGPKDGELRAAIQELRASGQVEYVEEDPIAFAVASPNDPGLPNQWAHDVVHSREAWDVNPGSKSVIVALIDSGVDYRHPDLADNIWTNPQDGTHGVNLINGSHDPMADDAPHYHGTHCAGSIGAVGNNGIGVIGSSPHVTILPLKFLSSSGSGNVSDAVRGIYFAIQNKAKVISNSWGSAQPSQALLEAITAARNAGVLFVVAAGNGDARGVGQNNDTVGTYPANYGLENVITVAATDSADNLTSFSNYGVRSVHVAAPGLNIYSTKNGASYQSMSGTSMATPLVAGVAATLIAARPDLDYRTIKAAILDHVDVVRGLQGKIVSGGRINAYRAISAIARGGPAPDPTPIPTPVPTSTPTPVPTPAPTPPPQTPVGSQARTPLLAGQIQLVVTHPFLQIPFDYDVSEFPGTIGVYIEVTRPNLPFSTSGVQPDPMRLNSGSAMGVRGRLLILPARDLPGWGSYQFRLIPVNRFNQPLAFFSEASVLQLRPY